MGRQTVGVPRNSLPSGPQVETHKIEKALVIENIKVIETTKKIEIPVPVLVDYEVQQKVYKDEIVKQIKYETKLEDTIRFVPKDEETIRYVPRDEETLRYIPKEVEVEKPVPVEKEYEKPVVKEVEYEVLKPKDIHILKDFLEEIPRLTKAMYEALTAIRAFNADLKKAEDNVGRLRDYKLVEEVIKVPKIEYVPVQVERVVWKNVERERPS